MIRIRIRVEPGSGRFRPHIDDQQLDEIRQEMCQPPHIEVATPGVDRTKADTSSATTARSAVTIAAGPAARWRRAKVSAETTTATQEGRNQARRPWSRMRKPSLRPRPPPPARARSRPTPHPRRFGPDRDPIALAPDVRRDRVSHWKDNSDEPHQPPGALHCRARAPDVEA